ncbi:MAG TPA: hypothetical protein VGK74_24595 [Symbiobacteriaceae bacterium]|jgi:hypothetical protein
MPNYRIFNDDPKTLNVLAYGKFGSTAIGVAVDSGGIVKTGLTNSGEPVDFPLTAFKDTRAAEIQAVVGWNFNYNVNADIVTTTTTGSGTVTPSNSKAVLQTGASASAKAQISTIAALRYSPGLGALVRLAALFTTGAAGSTQLIGIGDQSDGFFFGYSGSSFGVLRRQNGTDNFIPQSSWNGDKFDGTGSSGLVLDTTKGNVYSIQYQWLGFGPIDFTIESPAGKNILAHRIEYPNSSVDPSIFNPTLPLMAQVENTANTTNIKLETSSGMGFVEGNAGQALVTRNSILASKTAITSEIAVITIRDKATFQGRTNRIRIQNDFLSISTAGTVATQIQVIKNTTLGGTPSFTDVSTSTSVVDYDTAGTTVTGGKTILSFQMGAVDSVQLFVSTMNIRLNPGDTLTVAASSLASTTVQVSLSWEEFF